MSAANEGFRRTASPRSDPTASDAQAPISERILAALSAGRPPRRVAASLGVPLDFVSLVTEQARRSGKLDYYDLATGNCGSGPGCNPDPDSLVCASCPILPAAVRRRQSILGRLLNLKTRH
ncbi:peptidase [Bifidobacterium xylocopae]|uniref:Peptidase n=1 Tax=Bifidobacterium xylocopae TaxID=2493119 RepID=A0A366KCD6_9BIFI|nr:peptidase [Bifidobacterium xylocopae]RBP99027.1 peptidase [Bifidobacterium xylocopae]